MLGNSESGFIFFTRSNSSSNVCAAVRKSRTLQTLPPASVPLAVNKRHAHEPPRRCRFSCLEKIPLASGKLSLCMGGQHSIRILFCYRARALNAGRHCVPFRRRSMIYTAAGAVTLRGPCVDVENGGSPREVTRGLQRGICCCAWRKPWSVALPPHQRVKNNGIGKALCRGPAVSRDQPLVGRTGDLRSAGFFWEARGAGTVLSPGLPGAPLSLSGLPQAGRRASQTVGVHRRPGGGLLRLGQCRVEDCPARPSYLLDRGVPAYAVCIFLPITRGF